MKTWMAKQKAKATIMKVFRNGEIGNKYSYGSNNGLVYPKILSIKLDYSKKTLSYLFSLPTGMDPKEIKKKEYCFKQVFGDRIELKGDNKRFTLTVFTASIPAIVRYNPEQYQEQIKNMKLPIVCGVDMNGMYMVYNMVNHPHLLIAGETGSGKSTQLRSILTTLIQTIPPERLELYLCDLKRSEFHLFRDIKHVQKVLVSPKEMLPVFHSLQGEIRHRGDLLDAAGLSHVDDLPDPPPYIVLCIDEVALLKKEKALMEIVEEISAVGRALGIFIILSMQRPDSKLLDGALKNNLTVRMGFKCADLINSRIIGTPGSEKLKADGRMLLKLQGLDDLKEIQAPYLSVDKAKKLLMTHKGAPPKDIQKPPSNDSDSMIDIQTDIFEVLD